MDNGTTAIQVSPITEDDMNRVKSILQRAADAIVGMSQLHADVDMLRQTVSGLQADTDRLRNQNAALDEALAHSRTVRDDQAQTISGLASKLDAMTQERDELKGTASYNADLVDRLKAELTDAKRDRDDHAFKAMELEDKLKASEELANKLRVHFDNAYAMLEVPKAMQPAPPQPPHPIQAVDEANPMPPTVDWDKPTQWDAVKGCYVNVPAPTPNTDDEIPF